MRIICRTFEYFLYLPSIKVKGILCPASRRQEIRSCPRSRKLFHVFGNPRHCSYKPEWEGCQKCNEPEDLPLLLFSKLSEEKLEEKPFSSLFYSRLAYES